MYAQNASTFSINEVAVALFQFTKNNNHYFRHKGRNFTYKV